MFRSVLSGVGGCLQYAFLPILERNPDTISVKSPTYEKREDYNETGMERVRAMFATGENIPISPEVNSIHQAGFFGMLFGAIAGGFMYSRVTYMNFMENNQATVYETHLEAKRQLQYEMTKGLAKGAFRWGWRLALFTTSYSAIVTVMSVYRGKSSIWEYIVAGTTTGAFYKINLGLKGMVSGGFFGGVFGAIAGGLTVAVLNVSGVSMQDIRYFQYKWREARDNAIKGVVRAQLEEPDFFLENYHSQGNSDNTLNVLGDSEVEAKPSETITNTKLKVDTAEK